MIESPDRFVEAEARRLAHFAADLPPIAGPQPARPWPRHLPKGDVARALGQVVAPGRDDG